MMKSVSLSVACFACWTAALAQSANLGGSPPGSGAKSAQSNNETRRMRLRETTATGCILGQNGKYILITSKQSSVLQLVATPSLEAHVGHKVKITGTVEDAPVVQPAITSSSKEANEAHTSTSADLPVSGELRVRKIKTVSATCDAKPDKASKKSWIRILSL